MISKILAGAVVIFGMGLLLMGFTYNNVNQRGPLGAIGEVFPYVFPHKAGYGLSVQTSAGLAGTSAPFYVTPAGVMTVGDVTAADITADSFSLAAANTSPPKARWLRFGMDAFNPATDVGRCLPTNVVFADSDCGAYERTVYHVDDNVHIDRLFLACTLASTEDTDVITFAVHFIDATSTFNNTVTANHTFATTEDNDQIEIEFDDTATAGTAMIQLEVDAYTDNGTTATTDLECAVDLKVFLQ